MREIIEKLTAIKDSILTEKSGGKLRFFGALVRADMEEKWDLLISADWVEKNSSEEDLVYIIKKLKDSFGEKLDFLFRIVLLKPDETFVRQLAKAIIRENGGKPGEITNLAVNAEFTLKQLIVIALDFSGIDLDSPSETTDGPIGIKSVNDF